MKTVLRKRYYCDFCNKTGGSAFHIKKHESSCTNNPVRVCKMCKEMGIQQVSIDALLVRLKLDSNLNISPISYLMGKPVNQKKVSDMLYGITECPVCVFTALRRNGLLMLMSEFNLKDEIKEVRKSMQVNGKRRLLIGSYQYYPMS